MPYALNFLNLTPHYPFYLRSRYTHPWWHFLLLCLSSAILSALSQSNEWYLWGNPLLGLLAFVPYFYALSQINHLRWAILLSDFMGFFISILQYFWLFYFQEYNMVTVIAVALGHVIVFSFLSPFLWYAIKRKNLYTLIYMAFAWVIFEGLKSKGVLAFSWGYLAYTFYSLDWLKQIVDITGIWGLSFLLGLSSFYIAQYWIALPQWMASYSRSSYLKKSSSGLLVPPYSRSYFIYAGLFVLCLWLLCFIYGKLSLNRSIPILFKVDTLMLQMNHSSWGNTWDEKLELVNSIYTYSQKSLTETNSNPDLIVISEGLFPIPLFDNIYNYIPSPQNNWHQLLASTRSAWLIGSSLYEDNTDKVYNTAILSQGTDLLKYRQDKIQLVPVAEGNPFEGVPGISSLLNYWGFNSFYSYGRQINIFTIPTYSHNLFHFSVSICYDDAFGNLNRKYVLKGAQALVNISDDSWAERHSSQIQHFINSSFRSIELRKTTIRTTNTGLSAVIDPWGNNMYTLPSFEQDTLRVLVPIYNDGLTIYAILGDWLLYLSVFIIMGAMLINGINLYVKKKYYFI